MITRETIQNWVKELSEESITTRRYIHAHPELSFQEYQTTEFIVEKLSSWQIPFTRNPAGTGLIGRLDSNVPGPVLAFRADLDALPIAEESGAPFTSQTPNVMHACGHDIHMTILLGLAHILSLHREALLGSVLFIFQPAEENYPGGARSFVESGLLEEVNCYFGLHVDSDTPLGSIGLREGPTMASPSTFHITIHGKSGHGAKPQDAADPLVTACQLVLALQTIVSRNVSPMDTAVVSVCHLESGSTHNVIPEYAHLTGTIRTFSDEVLALIEKRMRTMCEHICHAMGTECELVIDPGYPVVVNQPKPTAHIREAAQFMGHPVLKKEPFMIGEDFSYYINHRTGCFFHLGVATDNPQSRLPLHNAKFLPEEEAIFTGMEIMLATCLRYQETKILL